MNATFFEQPGTFLVTVSALLMTFYVVIELVAMMLAARASGTCSTQSFQITTRTSPTLPTAHSRRPSKTVVAQRCVRPGSRVT